MLATTFAIASVAALTGSASAVPPAHQEPRPVIAPDRSALLRQVQVLDNALALSNALALADVAAADAVATQRIASDGAPPELLASLDSSADRLRGLVTPGGYGQIPPGYPVTPTLISEATAEVFQAAAQVRAADEAAAAATAGQRWAAPPGLEELEGLTADALASAERLEGLALEFDFPAVDAADLCTIPFAPTHLLRCDAVDALVALNAAYRADHGRDLVVASAFRTLEQQAALRLSLGSLAAPPGASNHEKGVAVDFGGVGGLGEFTSPGYQWLVANAPAFGWVHPPALGPGGNGPPEPWHWEFVGTSWAR